MDKEQFHNALNRFRPGDFVGMFSDDYMGAGKIVDIMKSDHTGNIAVIVKFIRNIGNDNNDRYGGDIFLLSPDKKIGMNPDTWKKLTDEEIQAYLENRKSQLDEKLNNF